MKLVKNEKKNLICLYSFPSKGLVEYTSWRTKSNGVGYGSSVGVSSNSNSSIYYQQ